MKDKSRALGNVRIVDLTDERAIYGVKLLSDLGAQTVRPVPIEGDPLNQRGPFEKESGKSLWYAHYVSNRKVVRFDQSESARSQLHELCVRADLVIVNDDHAFESILDCEKIQGSNKRVVIVECSSFGQDGPWKDFLGPDLVAGALGGSVAVTGDVDTSPINLFGGLNFVVSGLYVAIASLAALHNVRNTGKGQKVHVPVHECIASCLEHVFMWYLNAPAFRHATGRALKRRGSLHWTNLYEVVSARNGNIMVTPTPSLDNQLVWLIEEDVYDDLLDDKYYEEGNRGAWARRMMEILRDWVAKKDVESLFFEAQQRHCPFGWVHDISQVAENPHLSATKFWQSILIGNKNVQSVGAPYRLQESPAQVKESEQVSLFHDDVLSAVGWDTN